MKKILGVLWKNTEWLIKNLLLLSVKLSNPFLCVISVLWTLRFGEVCVVFF